MIAAPDKLAWISAVEHSVASAINELVVSSVVDEDDPIGSDDRRRTGFDHAGIELSRAAGHHRGVSGLSPVDQIGRVSETGLVSLIRTRA